jgi:hypothetical protein
MVKFAIAVLASTALGSAIAKANEKSAAIYYKGEQPVGVGGEVVDCFVEASYSSSGQSADLRLLVADAHDGDMVGVGPVKATYNNQKVGYGYTTANVDDKIQELFLKAESPKIVVGLSLIVLDGTHTDAVTCNRLNASQGTELTEVQEKFEHFGDYVEEDHDHDHRGEHRIQR